jgi:glycosyltransferase involved in cell wall biosynthesis
MNDTPKISVLMSVWNSEEWLRPAIESVLNQTFRNFEFLIMNDASTDGSADIIKSYKDERIRLIDREKNIGLQKNLFDGVNIARGEYIARMDSDDICLPERFAEQVKFMDENPNIGLCGSWYRTFGAGDPLTDKPPTDPDDVRANMLFYTSFAHPTVMLRKSLFNTFHLNYNTEIRYCEDYELWSRCLPCFPIANIPKVLLFYRIRPGSAFQAHKQETWEIAYQVRYDMLSKLGIDQTNEEKRLHNFLKPAEGEKIHDFLSKQENWLKKIIAANGKNPIYKTGSLNKVIYERWRTVCGMNASAGFVVFKTYFFSPLFKLGGMKKYRDGAKILIKSLLRKR